MSGGHWGYMQLRFDEAAEEEHSLTIQSLKLLGQIEHELDWGHSCDTCLTCARLRVVSALDVFYDNEANATAALSVLRDREAVYNTCTRCLTRLTKEPAPYRREGSLPTIEQAAAELGRRYEAPT